MKQKAAQRAISLVQPPPNFDAFCAEIAVFLSKLNGACLDRCMCLACVVYRGALRLPFVDVISVPRNRSVVRLAVDDSEPVIWAFSAAIQRISSIIPNSIVVQVKRLERLVGA